MGTGAYLHLIAHHTTWVSSIHHLPRRGLLGNPHSPGHIEIASLLSEAPLRLSKLLLGLGWGKYQAHGKVRLSGGPRERLLLTGLLPHSDHEARRLLLLRYVSLKMLPRHQERFKRVPTRYQEDNQEDNHPPLSHCCEERCMFAPLPASCLRPP
jgi:hypothetical protein